MKLLLIATVCIASTQAIFGFGKKKETAPEGPPTVLIWENVCRDFRDPESCHAAAVAELDPSKCKRCEWDKKKKFCSPGKDNIDCIPSIASLPVTTRTNKVVKCVDPKDDQAKCENSYAVTGDPKNNLCGECKFFAPRGQCGLVESKLVRCAA